MTPLLLLSAALSVASDAHTSDAYLPSPQLGEDGAYTDCPCVEIGPLPSNRTYGIRCLEWPDLKAGCTGPSAPAWCRGMWCYVDPHHCQRQHTASTLARDAAWSYEACGNLGNGYIKTQGNASLSSSLRRPLYVYADGGYARKEQPLGMHTDLGRRGALAFAYHMLQHLGLDADSVRYRQLSNASMRLFPLSKFTACVHEIALGNIDLCLGDLLDLDARRAMNVSFTGSIFVEDFYLVVNKQFETNSISNSVSKTFLPFSFGLWVLIVGTLLFSIGVLITFETRGSRRIKNLRSMSNIATALVHSMMAGELTFMPVTHGGKIFSMGYGFFILVCLSCYTANMASILISDQQSTGMDTIDKAVQSGMRICHHAAFPMEELKLKYPAIGRLSVPIDDTSGRASQILTECEVAILSKMNMADYWANGRFCKKRVINKPILSFPNGYYASEPLAREFSWMVSRLRQQGYWQRVLHEVRVPSQCKQLEEEDDDTAQLEVWHMLGALVVLVVTLLLALGTEAAKFRLLKRHNRELEESNTGSARSETSTVDDDGETSLPEEANSEHSDEVRSRVEKAQLALQQAQEEFSRAQFRVQRVQDELQADLDVMCYRVGGRRPSPAHGPGAAQE